MQPKYKDGTYNREIYWPFTIALPSFRPTYTMHAREQAAGDRYGHISLPNTLKINPNQIIEATIERGRLVKVVARIAYSQSADLVLVIREQTVITVWLNLKTDKHGTLNARNYIAA